MCVFYITCKDIKQFDYHRIFIGEIVEVLKKN